jgi:glycosyltransferase involved in cell wall biosynthesis
MRILLVHNTYREQGGEDAVVEQEAALLREAGHIISEYRRANDETNDLTVGQKFFLAKRMIWASDAVRDLLNVIQREKPEIVHFHNTFLMISPAAYYACRRMRIPVVQTLHNYRMLCPNALFFRDGHVCEDCLLKLFAWPGVAHACYRGNRVVSGAVATMLAVHRLLRTWKNMVDVYITLTEAARQKFIQGGLPAEQIVVKPNFVHADPGVGEGQAKFALFAGRLSPEKGIHTLLAAWEKIGEKLPLKIVGDGPMANWVAEFSQRVPGVEWLGRQPREKVLALMKEALILIFPSIWYEGFPMTLVEAYSVGLPVIASNLGSMSTLVEQGRTGLQFRPGDADDLVAQVLWALSHPSHLARMRREVRAEFEMKYTAARNYEMLKSIYAMAIEHAKSQTGKNGRKDSTH